MTPQLVRQEDARGCGVACAAMLLGRSYQAVKAEAFPYVSDTTGVHYPTLWDYLSVQGLALRPLYRFIRTPAEFSVERKPWPPAPFADVHLVEVVVSSAAPCNHFVLWLRDGTILDPLGVTGRKLTDFHQVNHLCGVYHVAEPLV